MKKRMIKIFLCCFMVIGLCGCNKKIIVNSNGLNNMDNLTEEETSDGIIEEETSNGIIEEETSIEKNINTIDISLDNWDTYFEFADKVEWDYNDFNEVDGMAIRKVIRLKSDYYEKIANDSRIAFEVSGIIIDKILIPDYPNQSYTLKDTNGSGILGNGMSETKTISLNLSTDYYKQDASVYWCHDGYYMENNEKVISIDVLEQENVIRVQGTLYLYD